MTDAERLEEIVDYLECNVCGGEAVEAEADGLFGDTDTQPCMTCGHPGRVIVWDGDDPPTAEWTEDQWCVATCVAAEHTEPIELEAKPMMQGRFPKRAGEDTVEL